MSQFPGMKRPMEWTPVDLSSKKTMRSQRYLESHKLIEKRRRDRINNYLQAIRSLLPVYMYNLPSDKRLDKADILDMTVLYLRMMDGFLKNLGVKDLFCAVHQQLGLLSNSERWIQTNSKNYSSVPEFASDLLGFLQDEQNKSFKQATETVLPSSDVLPNGPSCGENPLPSCPSQPHPSDDIGRTLTSTCCSRGIENGPPPSVRSLAELRSRSKFYSGITLQEPAPNADMRTEQHSSVLTGNMAGGTSNSIGWSETSQTHSDSWEQECHLANFHHEESFGNENEDYIRQQDMKLVSGSEEVQSISSSRGTKSNKDECQRSREDSDGSKEALVNLALSVTVPEAGNKSPKQELVCTAGPCDAFSKHQNARESKVLYCVQDTDNLTEVGNSKEDSPPSCSRDYGSRQNKCHCDFKVLVRDKAVNTDQSKENPLFDKELTLKVDTGRVELDVSSLILQAQSQDGSCSIPITFKGQVCLDVGDKKQDRPRSSE